MSASSVRAALITDASTGIGAVYAGRLAEAIEVCNEAWESLPEDPKLGVEFIGHSPFLGMLVAEAWAALPARTRK